MKTLHQMSDDALAAGEAARSNYIAAIASSSDLLGVFPFLDVTAGAYVYTGEGQLPGVAFEGDEPNVGDGILNPRVEALKVLCGDLDVAPSLPKTHGSNIRGTVETMKGRALGAYLTDAIINGDRLSEEVPTGLKHRIIQEQHWRLDDGRLNRDLLGAVIDSVDGATHILVGKSLRNWLGASGWLTWGHDAQGRRASYYQHQTNNGVQVLRVLSVGDNPFGAPMIGYAEPQQTTSLYVLNIGDTGVCGIQNEAPAYNDLGECPYQEMPRKSAVQAVIDAATSFGETSVPETVLRARAEWLAAFAVLSGRAAARLSGIAEGRPTV